MRTSISIDDQIYLEAKKLAAESKKTLANVIEDALRTALAKKNIKKTPVSLITINGKGLKHGIDLDNSQSLNDIMDD